MYGYLVILLGLLCSTNTQMLNPFNNLVKQYKKTTLRLREDSYQNNLPILSSYDYIVVGASPSGCVLANRLTEDPDTTVLLLEAGPDTSYYNDVPFMHLLLFDSEYNWKFSSRYNPAVCRSMNKKTCPWPSGKGIGGGTAINALIFTRGNKKDFDSWAAEGNEGWSYEEVLPYFKKMENTRPDELRESPYRGSEGPIWVSYTPYRSNGSDVFLQAGKELGYPTIDYNGPYRSGFGKMQLSLKEGYRSNGPNAYLKPVTSRPNLHIAQRAMVTKILFDANNEEASGVEFFKKNKRRKVLAKREVIVSAGGFGSPKLLMLSGIGPKEHLKEVGIPVVKDLPAGNNLQEHVGITSLTFIADKSSTFVPDYSIIFPSMPQMLLQYDRVRAGPPSTSGADSVAYVNSRFASENEPDIELFFVGATYASDFGNIIRKTIGVSDNVYNSYYKALENETSLSIWIMGCYPKSRGTIRLASKNPLQPPLINNNFLEEKDDVTVIIDGIKKALEVMETSAMKRYGVRLYKKNVPGCEMQQFGSDEYWECAIRQVTAQYHHQSGTCRMGPKGDPRSVVDSRLRVHGIRRLRVVDVSIMPTITAGHTQAPAYMIGEKAADMIKEDRL